MVCGRGVFMTEKKMITQLNSDRGTNRMQCHLPLTNGCGNDEEN